ncbi:hypothetical protein Agabi119p4_8562 [Agaricus bisporus var. burnettii]|uniref:Homoserine dehydrogenase n=1 Tax=Agaricus bisporus var. burnettii TaxID=192524 RepID=A0A8H7EYM6_AGABI|nr:hypothetical protein Agabi119p4_8562 [Agaricus bisporus var. burnettii]
MASQSRIHVAIVGVGLVGSELVNQILAIPQQTSPFSLISLSNSTRTLTNPINPGSDWRSALAASKNKADLGALTKQLSDLVAQNKRVAIVDNTSSDHVAALYPEWLRNGFHVVTPNKKAYSGELSLFEDILESSKTSGGRFLYEATVGAGLPVVKIEGVFSGTMSYIFNEFSTGKPDGPDFSSVVAVAREKGYTEPHPADDLNGFDVARKLTILSRTISAFSNSPTNLPQLQSFKTVQTASLIPPALEGIPTGDDFISRLPEHDSEFAKLRTDASAEGQVLRFVGVVDAVNGQVKAGLEKYPVTHPFATSLGGSDNIVLFHTERYSPRPLIVQGAGAGAAVTAMGVLGDLLKL